MSSPAAAGRSTPLSAGFSNFKDLDPSLREEFCAFEGNAQGFRIIARTEMYRNDGGMCLSKAVLGAFMKYPLSAATKKGLAGDPGKDNGYKPTFPK